MNHCLILPVPMLEKYGTATPVHAGTPRMHLCLNHLLQEDDYPLAYEYHSYYLERREAGDYIIMDNGADEHAEGDGILPVLSAAASVRAQEIVLPDVQYESAKTIEHTTHALDFLGQHQGRVAYNKASRPRVQVVPQGQTYQAWIACAEILIDLARTMMARIEGPSIVVGVAKQYHAMFKSSNGEGGRVRLVNWLYSELHEHEDVHLLGYPRGAHDLGAIEKKTPGFVRSVDSAKPVVYALNGIKVESLNGNGFPEYPLRPDAYFGKVLTREQEEILEYNIWRFTRGC